MKVIEINGSPKGDRSNTMKLTRAFLEGGGWTDIEIVALSQLTLKSCLGCYGCWTATPGKCVIDDDMAEMLPKLIGADLIIWSFPLYGCFFPGYLKIFMDRMLPLSMPQMVKEAQSGEHPLRYDLTRQRHFYISTCGFWTSEGNYSGPVIYFVFFSLTNLLFKRVMKALGGRRGPLGQASAADGGRFKAY